MFGLIHRLAKLDVNDLVAIYAAVLSTLTACVQIVNARRDRARLRVKLSRERPNVPDAAKKIRFFVVSVANTGSRAIPIFRPQLQVIQRVATVHRMFYVSPGEEYDDYHADWANIQEYGSYEPEQPFELKETEAQSYRFTVSKRSKVLTLRIIDRAGVTRYRRRMFWSPLHRAVFWARNVGHRLNPMQKTTTAKNAA